ncbi:MAG TPA: MBL fold metallo-hydrolase [Burkholderiaceae bacterium]|nr:MBL fold metallo-hydrolase [Burkholderiaceae bacterium]
MQTQVTIQAFFDEPTNTVSYLVSDPKTHQAAVIDPVLDYDHAAGKVATRSADAILDAAARAGLEIIQVLETHAHADHLSAAPHIRERTGAKIGIGRHICQVQRIFRDIFNLTESDVSGHGIEFDQLFDDGDSLMIGELEVHVMHTPGHTPACVAYQIGDAVFVGDTLFMPDYGTARADFPGGDARVLYRSIRRILSLPPHTRLFLCHDYKAPGRDHYAWETTVEAQRRHNIHVRDGISEDEFVEMRTNRDATLSAPTLLLPSIQVNIRAGRLPDPESNGTSYLKIPVSR